MGNIDNYVQIMIESLKKKQNILDRIIRMNERQLKCIKVEQFDEIDWDTFNIIVTEKEAEIDRINEMDMGFQTLFDRIGDQLKSNKDNYSQYISEMQRIIADLEEKSVKIRTGEEKNRAIIERVLSGRKREIKQVRTSLKAASNYYSSMRKPMESISSSVDQKK